MPHHSSAHPFSRPVTALRLVVVALLAALALALLQPPAPAHSVPSTFTDNFNRANGGLGAEWTAMWGNGPEIESNRVRAPMGSAYAYLTSRSGTTVSMDVHSNGGSIANVGFVLGHSGGANSSSIVVQDNDGDGLFDSVFASGQAIRAGYYGSFTPTGTARLTLEESAANYVLTVTVAGVEVFASTLWKSASPGAGYTEVSGFRVGDGASLDNFSVTTSATTLDAPSAHRANAGSGELIVEATSADVVVRGDVTLAIAGQADQVVPLAEGSATFDLSALPLGTHSYTASYPYQGGKTAAAPDVRGTIQVKYASTIVTTITPDPASDPWYVGQERTVTFTVAGGPEAAGFTPTGTVAVRLDGFTILAGLTNGSGTSRVTFNEVVSAQIDATYIGDEIFWGAVAHPVTASVAPVPTTAVLTGPTAAVEVGEPVTVTATVTRSGGAIVGSGNVQFAVGGTAYPAAISNGVATLTYVPTTVGDHVVTASYAGTAALAASTAPPLTVGVVKIPTAIALGATPATWTVGESTTLVAVLTARGAVATAALGTVTFEADGVVVGTADLAGGEARLLWTPTSVGEFAVTATYSGSDMHAGSVSSAQTAESIAHQTTVAAALSPSRVTLGETALLRASVAAPGSVVDAGTATFLVNGVAVGAVDVRAGFAELAYTPATVGTFAVTVRFGASMVHADAVSAAAVLDVTAVPARPRIAPPLTPEPVVDAPEAPPAETPTPSSSSAPEVRAADAAGDAGVEPWVVGVAGGAVLLLLGSVGAFLGLRMRGGPRG